MKARLHNALPDILILTLLLVVPLLFFAPQTLGGKTLLPVDNLYQWEPYRSLSDDLGVGRAHNPLLSDLILENAAWKLFARAEIADAEIPLWQPHILAGSPFLAAGQSSMLYPFSVLFLIMPVHAAFGWFTVLQLWLAGAGMYLFVRVLGVRRGGALISALTYQMAGFMLASVVFPMIIATAAWLPWLLAMLELVIRQRPVLGGQPASLPWAALGAVALGMAALAGHVEALYFTLLVMAFYAAWRLLAELVAGWRERGIWRRVAMRGLWAALMVAAGLALGAVQIIPAYELASRSFRSGAASLQDVLGWAYPPRRVLAFLMPNFFGSPAHHSVLDVFTWQRVPLTTNALGQPVSSTAWGIKNYVEGAAYTGILPLLLAAGAVVHWVAGRLRGRGGPHVSRYLARESAARPYRALFGVLAALSASFAFGMPTYALLYYGLPFINQSHAPFRWVWPLTLCVAVLAGFGAEAVTLPQGEGERGRRRQLADVLGWLGIGGGAAVILGVVASRLLYGALAGLVERVFFSLAGAANAFPDARAFYSYQAINALIFGVMLLLAGLAVRLMRSGRRAGRAPAWSVFAALVVALDLGAASWGFNPAADPALLDAVPPSIAWLRERVDPLDPWRLAVYEEPGRDTLNANMAWLHGLEDISGYDSLIPAQYAEFMQALMPQGDLPYNRIAPLYTTFPEALDSPLLDLLGVRYIVTELEIDNPRFMLAYEDEAVRIYENAAAMPRAYTLPLTSTQVYPAEAGGFAEAIRSVDVRRQVLLPADEPDSMPVFPGTPADPGPATITDDTLQQQMIDVAVSEESWLVVTGSYFPGWRAWLRPFGADESAEQEVPVELVNGNFRGVRLPPGEWTVRMKYSPDSFRFGAFASFLTGMALIFALGVWAYRGLYREDPEAGGIQRVAKNTVTPVVLNIFSKGISFVLTFAMLRVLGPAGAGRYTYAIIVYGWFEILANFGLNTFLLREVARNRDEANRYLVNTTVLRLGLVLLNIPLVVGFVLFRQYIAPQFVDAAPLEAETIWALGLLYSGLLFSTISTGLTALFYAYERAELPATIQTVSAFLTTTLGITALLLGGGIIGLATVSVIVNVVTLAILSTLAVRQFFRPRLELDWGLQRAALGESFPLMLNHLFATLFFRVDVVLLELLQSDVVVGWYRVVYTWVDAIMVIPSYFTLSLFPVMSRQAVEDRPALKRAYILAIKLMSLISVPTAIMTTLLAPFLVNVLGGAEYLPHGAIALQIFIWSILIGWINSVTQYVIIALGRQRTLTIAFIVVLVFNVVLNWVYIPRYSYAAAAFTTILSEFVLWGMFYVVVLSELGRINWARTLWRIAAAGVLTGVATYTLGGLNLWLGFAAGLLVYVAAVFALRPLSDDEMQRIAPVIPSALRARLLPRTQEAASGVE